MVDACAYPSPSHRGRWLFFVRVDGATVAEGETADRAAALAAIAAAVSKI